jgi:hypothetical protein
MNVLVIDVGGTHWAGAAAGISVGPQDDAQSDGLRCQETGWNMEV